MSNHYEIQFRVSWQYPDGYWDGASFTTYEAAWDIANDTQGHRQIHWEEVLVTEISHHFQQHDDQEYLCGTGWKGHVVSSRLLVDLPLTINDQRKLSGLPPLRGPELSCP